MVHSEATPRYAIFGAGFLGGSLVERLAQEGRSAHVLDRNPRPENLQSCIEWYQGDFATADLNPVLAGVDVAVHLVGNTVPGDEPDAVAAALTVETLALNRLLDACCSSAVQRVVLASSAAVYGVQDVLPIPETAAPSPISAYGHLKLTQEQVLTDGAQRNGLRAVTLRIANPYGPRQRLDGRQGYIGLAIGKIKRGEPVMLRGNGEAVRDFVYIDDVIDAIELAAAGHHDGLTYNIGSGVGHTLVGVLDVIGSLMGKEIARSYAPARNEDIPCSVLDFSSANVALGYEPQVTLSQGLRRILRFHGLL